jgi:hypothetical protein
MPKISQADGLTGTERALLSPSEQEIAKRSWPQKQQENI